MRQLALLAVALTGCQGEPGAQDVSAHIDEVENRIKPAVVVRGENTPSWTLAERMEEHGVPGVSIAVFDQFEIEWAKGYGLADTEDGRPVTRTTLFQAASISKPVAATAALKFVLEGELALDEDVNERLVSWRVPPSAYTSSAPVTLRGLLTHTAGTTVHGFPGYATEEWIPSTVEVLEGRGNTDPILVDSEPGSEWRYSGGGYTVAQLLMTDVAERPFPTIMWETVLEPAAMTESTFEQPLPEERWELAASGYDSDGERVGGKWHIYPEMAAAGLWTTPTDLARWAIDVQRTYAGESHTILSRKMVKEMLDPGINGWGLGPAIAEDGTRFWHGGSNAGFRAQFVAFLEGGRGAVVMTNSDDGGLLIREILTTLAGAYDWPALGPKEVVAANLEASVLRRYAGRYDFPGLGIVTIESGENRLWADVPEMGRVVLVPESETEFVDLDEGAKVSFVIEGGRVVAFVVEGFRAEKIE